MSNRAVTHPICLAIVICEGVITDEQSKNKTIVNTFNQIHCVKLPCFHDRLTLFITLTGIRRKTILKAELTKNGSSDQPADTPIFSVQGEIECDDPLNNIDFIFNFRNVPFTEPGQYSITIFADDTIVNRRQLSIVRHDLSKGDA